MNNDNEDPLKALKHHFGYTDEEFKLFRSNPRNLEILQKAAELMGKTIVAGVVESHGCNSQHKVGDKFYFDGAGNLLTKLNPKKNLYLCIERISTVNIYFKRIDLCRCGSK